MLQHPSQGVRERALVALPSEPPNTGGTEPAAVDLRRFGAQVERYLVGERRYTRRQVAELAGVDPAESYALWRSLGFAEIDEDEVAFTDQDLEAFRLAEELAREGMYDEHLRASISRVVGQSAARTTEWEVERILEVIAAHPTMRSSEQEITSFMQRVMPQIEAIHGLVRRRHLAAQFQRVLNSTPALEDGPQPQSVAFVDMTGYTTLSQRIDQAELAAVLDRFEERANEICAQHGGRIIKSIGDEILFVADEPATAASIALDLLAAAEADAELPTLHAGIAHGPVLRRFGDVYGPTVNIASRLASIARSGTVLVDRAFADQLATSGCFQTSPLPPMSVRGIDTLELSVLQRAEVVDQPDDRCG